MKRGIVMTLIEAIEYLKKGFVIYRPNGVMFTEYEKGIGVTFEDALEEDWNYAKDFKKLCDIKCVKDNSSGVFYYKCEKLKNMRLIFDNHYRLCGVMYYDSFVEKLLSNSCCVADWKDIKIMNECEYTIMFITRRLKEI